MQLWTTVGIKDQKLYILPSMQKFSWIFNSFESMLVSGNPLYTRRNAFKVKDSDRPTQQPVVIWSNFLMFTDSFVSTCSLIFYYSNLSHVSNLWTPRWLPFSFNISYWYRVATPQGKQGIWRSIFPDRENTGNLPKDIKNAFLHREFNSNTGKIWRWKKMMSLCNLSRLNCPLAVLYHFNPMSF